MPENKNPSDVSYEIEDAKPKKAKGFGKSRGAKIAAISVGAVVALAASFGIGVAAGLQLSEHNSGSYGPSGQFGPGQGFGDGDHRPPGGPDGDNDHGGFQVPNTTAPVNPSPAPSTTP
jgi:hypothetical protein